MLVEAATSCVASLVSERVKLLRLQPRGQGSARKLAWSRNSNNLSPLVWNVESVVVARATRSHDHRQGDDRTYGFTEPE